MEAYLSESLGLNDNQIDIIFNLSFTNGEPAFVDANDINEIVGCLHANGFETTVRFVESCDDSSQLLWNQPGPIMPYLFSCIKREETMKLFKPKVITNLEPCKRCGSNKIRYAVKQIRAGDEGASVLVICANCGKPNRVA